MGSFCENLWKMWKVKHLWLVFIVRCVFNLCLVRGMSVVCVLNMWVWRKAEGNRRREARDDSFAVGFKQLYREMRVLFLLSADLVWIYMFGECWRGERWGRQRSQQCSAREQQVGSVCCAHTAGEGLSVMGSCSVIVLIRYRCTVLFWRCWDWRNYFCNGQLWAA